MLQRLETLEDPRFDAYCDDELGSFLSDRVQWGLDPDRISRVRCLPSPTPQRATRA